VIAPLFLFPCVGRGKKNRHEIDFGEHVLIRLHILLVDDETDARQAIEAAFIRDPFFAVRDCASGAEALTAAVAWRPDLILLDVMMADMDGPTLLERLRADKRTAPIPVIFLTASADAPQRQRLLGLGAAGVLAKPFDPQTLAAEVRSFVAAEGVLSRARESFMKRLRDDASALSAWRSRLTQTHPEPALERIREIAHALAGAGGIYGFAGITCASAALSDAAERNLAGRAKPIDVERALNRLLERIAP
jgi:CheY-like chemotaxis protein